MIPLRTQLVVAALGATLVLTGCSTLKGWLTPEGKKLTEATALLNQGHPLGATALAAEALALEPGYVEARDFFTAHFADGQAEFSSTVSRWTGSEDELRWDHLVEVYRWQQTLATLGPRVSVATVATVEPELRQAGLRAAEVHRNRARKLLDERDGPRQARLALAEVRTAQSYAPDAPGLAEDLAETSERATQRLMVVPFFSEQGGPLADVPSLVADEVSENLVSQALPALTTVFPAARLVTLPGAEKARQGRATQPDALDLAAAGGQNLVLLGQVTRISYTEPRRSLRVENRTRTVNIVSPDHPNGVPKVWNATVTYETWSTALQLGVSFSLVEVSGGRDVATGTKTAQVSDEATTATYSGDQEALTPEDLGALGNRPLVEASVLKDRVVGALANEVASWVRTVLR